MGSMMRKTTLREIKGTLGRFMAILAIIALGTGFFTGVRVTTPAMVSMMNDYLDERNFYDIRLVSTMGWDKETPAQMAEEQGVRYAEGSYFYDVLWNFTIKDSLEEAVTKTHMLTQDINSLDLLDGRLPEAPDECVSDTFGIGRKITVSDVNNDDVKDALGGREYTVVGRVRSPLYINFERGSTSLGDGDVSGFVYLPEESFDCDYYTEIYLRFDHDYRIYSKEYNDFIDKKTELWEELGKKYADARFDRIYADARAEIDDGIAELEEKRADGQQELDDALNELNDAENELADAKKKLEDGAKEIADNEKKLEDAKKDIDKGKAELADAKSELDDAKAAIDDSQNQLNDADAQLNDAQQKINEGYAQWKAGMEQYSAAEAEFYAMYGSALVMMDYLPPEQQAMIQAGQAQLEASKAALDSAKAELDAGQREIDAKRRELLAGQREFESGKNKYEQGLKEYEKGKADLENGEKEYLDGLKKLEDGKADYEKGLTEYEDGLKEFDSGKEDYASGSREFDDKIAEAEEEIADAERELADLERPEVFILNRGTNIGYACFESDSQIVEQVAKVFPIFFILVAALVCMTTMSRMVEEQRTQIGMLKALGYSNASIMGKFTAYSGGAAIIGCISGFFAGTYLFPRVIWMTYKLMYIQIDVPYLFDTKLAAAALAASLLCSIGTTWIACRYELSETAASLMRPKAPKAGKRVFLEYIGFIWNRLKFLHKVSVRNIFRYKGRLFMMILGIGGCMALLLTGFGIKDSIAGFADVQYNTIITADGDAYFDTENYDDVKALFAENDTEYTMFRNAAWDLSYGSRTKSVTLQIFEDMPSLSGFIDLHTVSGEKLDMPQNGEALVSHSIAERYGAKKGSDIVLRDSDMNELHLKVAGVFENHVYNYIFISAETYEAQLGEYPAMNCAYVELPDVEDKTAFAASLDASGRLKYIEMFSVIADRLTDMMSRLDYIVLVIIVCAAALAFIVIYNLTNINITERKREIATIKVLGFFRRETSAYVLRENLVLTAIGIICGVGLGILLHRFVMAQIVVDMVDFSVKISRMSFIYSILLTFLFNLAVNIFMQIKLEAINMAESLKSVD